MCDDIEVFVAVNNTCIVTNRDCCNETVVNAPDCFARAAACGAIDVCRGSKVERVVNDQRRQAVHKAFESRVHVVVRRAAQDLHRNGFTHRDFTCFLGHKAAHLDCGGRSRSAEVLNPCGCVDEDHQISSGCSLRNVSRSPSQPIPSRPSKNSRVSGTPTRRRKARSTAALFVLRPNLRMTSAASSSSISILVRAIHQQYTSMVSKRCRAVAARAGTGRRATPAPGPRCAGPSLASGPADYRSRPMIPTRCPPAPRRSPGYCA